MNFEAVTKC